MRFKARINSMEIEMDNPYFRQQIRDENRKDPIIGTKYLKEMEVDEWCKHLLENFFPNISGIWADHTHITHVEILAIVRFSFECGFIDLEDCESILPTLKKVVRSLLKLEEAWCDSLSKIKKISDNLKANHATQVLAACRENIAAIIIQIITLYQDDYFLREFPKYLAMKEDMNEEKELENFAKTMAKGKNYPFLNEYQNQTILFITMNFLNKSVTIGNQKT
jgi:hypothetical protein